MVVSIVKICKEIVNIKLFFIICNVTLSASSLGTFLNEMADSANEDTCIHIYIIACTICSAVCS